MNISANKANLLGLQSCGDMAGVRSEALIERYKDRWNWVRLSHNETFPWSESLIERYKDRWDWGGDGLSSYEYLPWSEALIERYEDRWDWRELCQNSGLFWSVFLLEKFENKIDWWEVDLSDHVRKLSCTQIRQLMDATSTK
jgi:hypothetical protein